MLGQLPGAFVALAVFMLFSSPGAGQDAVQPGAAAGAKESVLTPGDLVFVNVHRHPDLSTTTQVDDAGNIAIPLIGKVSVDGLTEAQATTRVTEALSVLLKNPRVMLSRGSKMMTGGDRAPGMQTQLVQLQNSDAEVVYEALAGMVSSGGNIGVDRDTNSLIITDEPAVIQNIMSVVSQLDQLKTQITQVHIESKIAEVEAGALKELGVRWFAQGDHAGGGYAPTPRQDARIGAARGYNDASYNERFDTGNNRNNSGIGRRFIDEANFDRRLQVPIQVGAPGQMFLGYLNSGIDLGVMMDALVADNQAELLATPYIRTVNHKTAVIKMTEEFPYPEVGSVGLGTITNVRFLDIGIEMEVTPHVRHDPDGQTYIQMEVAPEVSFATGVANGVPIRYVRSSESVANVRDGQTLAIGGIMQTDTRDVVQQVPGLGSIPVVGALFKHKEKSTARRELMIFVTPRVYERPEDITVETMLQLNPEVHGANRLPPGTQPAEMRRE